MLDEWRSWARPRQASLEAPAEDEPPGDQLDAQGVAFEEEFGGDKPESAHQGSEADSLGSELDHRITLDARQEDFQGFD